MDSVPNLVRTKEVARVPKQQLPEIPVWFFRTVSGREPVLDWLRTLDKEDRRALAVRRMKEVMK